MSYSNNNIFVLDCWFEGRVQGVGFRYQTVAVAKGFEVSGTVRNLEDGRVHLHVEGEETEVLEFQKEVAKELASYIRDESIESDYGTRSCNGFRIVN